MRLSCRCRALVFAPAFLSMSLLLVACAGLPESTGSQPADWAQRLQLQNQLEYWTINARLGIQSETEGGSFDVVWDELPRGYEIRLIAPLGAGTVLIKGDSEKVVIKMSDGQEEQAANADEALARMTGIHLPLAGLHDLVRGMPMQGVEIDEISWNEAGQLYKLSQAGWHIEMNRYRRVGDYDLPHAFYLERPDRPDLSIRLVIRQWLPG